MQSLFHDGYNGNSADGKGLPSPKHQFRAMLVAPPGGVKTNLRSFDADGDAGASSSLGGDRGAIVNTGM